jgi:hypothetical protein
MDKRTTLEQPSTLLEEDQSLVNLGWERFFANH